jgi:uncharacterized protein (DUF302 family)
MSYYHSKIVNGEFDAVVEKVTEELKKEQFGVLTEIDFSGTLKKKIDVDIPKYKILGACNPDFAYKAYLEEGKIGTMLPCNVIVQQIGENEIEVSAVNPVASMQGVENDLLFEVAVHVKAKLEHAVDAVN